MIIGSISSRGMSDWAREREIQIRTYRKKTRSRDWSGHKTTIKGFVIRYCCSSHEMLCCVFAFLCIRKWEDLPFFISLRSAYFFVSLFYSSTTCRFALLPLSLSFLFLLCHSHASDEHSKDDRSLGELFQPEENFRQWRLTSESQTSNGKWTCVSLSLSLSHWSDLLNLLSLSLEHDPILISSRWRSIGHASVLSRSSALRVVGSRQRRILIDLSIQSTGYERIDRSALMNKRKELARD